MVDRLGMKDHLWKLGHRAPNKNLKAAWNSEENLSMVITRHPFSRLGKKETINFKLYIIEYYIEIKLYCVFLVSAYYNKFNGTTMKTPLFLEVCNFCRKEYLIDI